ncbi:hypothetical protein ACJEA3_005369, partial [Escherichia coli]
MNTETLCEISAHHFPTIIVKRSKLLIAAFFFIFRRHQRRQFFIQFSNFIFQATEALIHFFMVHYSLSPGGLTPVL